jgi:hypothetical protein
LTRGQSAREVVAAVGTPDEEIDRDWFYRVDDHSGYVIELDATERVAAVRSWKS